jgi:hypothetical protein
LLALLLFLLPVLLESFHDNRNKDVLDSREEENHEDYQENLSKDTD